MQRPRRQEDTMSATGSASRASQFEERTLLTSGGRCRRSAVGMAYFATAAGSILIITAQLVGTAALRDALCAALGLDG